jgi:hypothetical protein
MTIVGKIGIAILLTIYGGGTLLTIIQNLGA